MNAQDSEARLDESVSLSVQIHNLRDVINSGLVFTCVFVAEHNNMCMYMSVRVCVCGMLEEATHIQEQRRSNTRVGEQGCRCTNGILNLLTSNICACVSSVNLVVYSLTATGICVPEITAVPLYTCMAIVGSKNPKRLMSTHGAS